MNIVTSICVDEDEKDSSVKYPATLDATSEKRRIIYWKCVVVFFATSVRCNPDATHVLYTNDDKTISIKGVDVKEYLCGLGIEIRYLPFQFFKSPFGYSDAFKNAYYKLDVIKALGSNSNNYNILLDSDCVWTQHNAELMKLIESNNVLLYDVYKSYVITRGKHYRTRVNLGRLYKEINPDYPRVEPIQFGGEFIAGSSEKFYQISELLQDVYNLVLSKAKYSPLRVDEENTIFDGDEFLSSYVFNNMALNYIDAKDYIRRIWNSLKYSNSSDNDLDLTIWHVPSEKTQGIPLVYERAIKKESEFWHIPVCKFNIYLGRYLGVPNQLSAQRYLMLMIKVYNALQRYVSKKQVHLKKSFLACRTGVTTRLFTILL